MKANEKFREQIISHLCDMLLDAETTDGWLHNAGHGDVEFDDVSKSIIITMDDLNEQDYELIKEYGSAK